MLLSKAFRKGSCSWPLLLTICSGSSVVVNQHLTTARTAKHRPASNPSAVHALALTGVFVGKGIVRSLHFNAQRRPHKIEFFAEPPLQKPLESICHMLRNYRGSQ